MNNFIDFLENRLSKNLPGMVSHLKMAPLIDEKPYREFKPQGKFSQSAVLVLLFPDGKSDGEFRILLTLRNKNMGSHSGQISFPGGHSEKDELPYQTALRESNEEIGLAQSDVRILGNLSDLYVPPSKSSITPVVAYLDHKPDVSVKSPAEVEEVFDIPLLWITGDDYLKKEFWDFKSKSVLVPFWNVHHSTPLWGATAMILSELVDITENWRNKNLKDSS